MKSELNNLSKELILPKTAEKPNQVTSLGIILSPPYDPPSFVHHIRHRANLAIAITKDLIKKGLRTSPSFARANLQIHRTIIIPILTHGLAIITPSDKTIKLLQTAINKSVKLLLNYNVRSSTEWTLWQSQTPDALTLWKKLIIIRWRSDRIKCLESHNQSYIPHKTPSAIHQYATKTLKEWGFNPSDIEMWSNHLHSIPTKRRWKLTINDTIQAIQFNRFHAWMKENNFHCQPTISQNSADLHNTLATSKFLLTSHNQSNLTFIQNIRNNTLGLPGDQTLITKPTGPCACCNSQQPNHSQTISDMILTCPAFHITRKQLFENIIISTIPEIREFLKGNQTPPNILNFLLSPTVLASEHLFKELLLHLDTIKHYLKNSAQPPKNL
jgi:hypothetical protein